MIRFHIHKIQLIFQLGNVNVNFSDRSSFQKLLKTLWKEHVNGQEPLNDLERKLENVHVSKFKDRLYFLNEDSLYMKVYTFLVSSIKRSPIRTNRLVFTLYSLRP